MSSKSEVSMSADRGAGVVELERELGASYPFGGAAYLDDRAEHATKKYLDDLAAAHPSLREVAEQIHGLEGMRARRVLLDPIFRTVVNDERGRMAVHGKHERLALLGPLADETMARVGAQQETEQPSISLWNEAGAERTHAVRSIVAARTPGIAAVEGTAAERAVLVRAAKDVVTLLPELGASTLTHARLVVLGTETGDKPFRSTTSPYVPGMLMLSKARLMDDGFAVESLLHEATHLKYIEYEHGFAMYRAGYRILTSPRLRPPWHPDLPIERTWPLNRSATAMHVYTVLALLYWRAIEARSPIWSSDYAHSRGAECLSRACTLHAMISPYRAQFGVAGCLFLDWIGRANAMLERGAPFAALAQVA